MSRSGKIERIARLLPLLLACAAASGCAGQDFCDPVSGSELTLLVRPASRAGDESSNPFVFRSIQAALDATTGVQSTVCVSAGRYEERLTVPPFVHLLGEGPDLVQVRPPHSRFVPHAAFVDRVLLTLAPTPDGPVRVEGIDVADAAICADLVGEGITLLRDVVLHNCGVGLRGSSGTALVERSRLEGHFLWAVHTDGVQRLVLRDGTALTGNGFGALPGPFRPVYPGAWVRASELDGISAGGVVRASNVAALELDGVLISGNAFDEGSLVLDGTGWFVSDSEIQVDEVDADGETGLAGTGPVFLVSGGTGELTRTLVRTGGQELLRVSGSPADLLIDSSAWDGRGDEATVRPSDVGPAISLAAGGSLDVRHATLLGSGSTGLRIGDDAYVSVRNSVVWGHGDGAGYVVAGGAEVTGPELAWSLFEDNDVEGEELLEAADPDLHIAPVALTPAADSPLRCAGEAGAGSGLDLYGRTRPFESGKAPDVGAVERQESCP